MNRMQKRKTDFFSRIQNQMSVAWPVKRVMSVIRHRKKYDVTVTAADWRPAVVTEMLITRIT